MGTRLMPSPAATSPAAVVRLADSSTMRGWNCAARRSSSSSRRMPNPGCMVTKALVDEIGHGHRRNIRKWMVAWYGDAEPLTKQAAPGQRWLLWPRRDDRRCRWTRTPPRSPIASAAPSCSVNVTRGDASVKSRDQSRYHRRAERTQEAQPDLADGGIGQVFDRAPGGIELELGPARVVVKDSAVGVQRESLASAIEQRDPQSPFQASEHPGERRLREMKLFGCRRDVLQLRECDNHS